MTPEQLGPEFVAEHAVWVDARAAYFTKQLRSPYADVSQAVWEGLVRAHRLYEPGAAALHTWAYRYVLQALSDSRLGIRSSLTVPESTLKRYRKLMVDAGHDIWVALELSERRKHKISPATVHLVHMALLPPVELSEIIRREDDDEDEAALAGIPADSAGGRDAR